MHTRHVFVHPEPVPGQPFRLTGEPFHHLAHVLRARPGLRLVLRSLDGRAYGALVDRVGKDSLDLSVVDEVARPPDPPREVTVAQAIGRGDRFEEVLQRCTEVGVTGFVPLITERTGVALEPRAIATKMRRWRSILAGAAEQARRERIPVLSEPRRLQDALAGSCGGCAILLHPDAPPLGGVLRACDRSAPVLMLVGPEGGFSEPEVASAREAGALEVSVGAYVLRTETAALVAASLLLWS